MAVTLSAVVVVAVSLQGFFWRETHQASCGKLMSWRSPTIIVVSLNREPQYIDPKIL